MIDFLKLKEDGRPLFIRDHLVENVVSWHHHFSHFEMGGKPEQNYLKSTPKVSFLRCFKRFSVVEEVSIHFYALHAVTQVSQE